MNEEQKREHIERLDALAAQITKLRSEIEVLQRDLHENRKKLLKARTYLLDEEITVTIHLPLSWGGAGEIIDNIERSAHACDVRCKTTTIRTGWFSSRVDFELTGKRLNVVTFMGALEKSAKRSGIGWEYR